MSSMQIETVIEELRRIDGCRATLAKVEQVIKQLAGHRIYFAKRLAQRDAVAVTVRMLESRMPVADIARALVDRGLCRSRRSSYEMISKALDERARQKGLFDG